MAPNWTGTAFHHRQHRVMVGLYIERVQHAKVSPKRTQHKAPLSLAARERQSQHPVCACDTKTPPAALEQGCRHNSMHDT
jgi:hypothetical protein